jgi:hypothetical protein
MRSASTELYASVASASRMMCWLWGGETTPSHVLWSHRFLHCFCLPRRLHVAQPVGSSTGSKGSADDRVVERFAPELVARASTTR